ncbi:MAG: hypothetical protein JXR73_17535 [Candidatus Omnitrophica bacterium]|nr:hypothetical protein [Candidatus Omnitrophota bacterium]
MRRMDFFVCVFSVLAVTVFMNVTFAQDEQPDDGQPGPVRVYVAPRVVDDAPVMDGVVSEGEWDDAPVTAQFVGLRRTDNFNSVAQGEVFGSPHYQWQAKWDDDYLYLLVQSESFDMPINGILPGPDGLFNTADDEWVDEVNADDAVFSFAAGIGHDYDIYFEPNWQDGDGYNGDTADFFASDGNESDGYHTAIFHIRADPDFDFILGNEGIRNALIDPSNVQGPPWFYTEGNYDSAYNGGTWNPTFDPSAAAAISALPMLSGISHNFTGAEFASGDVFANLVVEIAFPFSQLNPEASEISAGSADGETNMTLVPDANGIYVNEGDEWLINIAGYTDAYTSQSGLTLVTWNDVTGNAFASFPRGILRFGGTSTSVKEWPVY